MVWGSIWTRWSPLETCKNLGKSLKKQCFYSIWQIALLIAFGVPNLRQLGHPGHQLCHLGRQLGHLGRQLGHLGRQAGHLGRQAGHLGRQLGYLG